MQEFIQKQPTNFHVYILKKRNYTTERAVRHITKALGLPRKAASYAGTKDKKALTSQYIVVKGAKKEHVLGVDLQDIKLTFIGYANRHFQLGDLAGNAFTITLRDVTKPAFTVPEELYIPNYFDEQRFSTMNVDIGLCLMRKEFDMAVKLLQDNDKDYSEKITAHLENKKNDYIGALRLLPKKTLLFFIHAVQSKIFNDLLSDYITQNESCTQEEYSQGIFAFPTKPQKTLDYLPLLGFDSQKYDLFLKKYGITARQFLLTSMPELSVDENYRPAFMKVINCSIHWNKNIATVHFQLPKGSYATIVIRQFFAMHQSD